MNIFNLRLIIIIGIIVIQGCNLNCKNEESPLFSFIQFSDVHVGAAINEPFHMRLNAAVILANKLGPSFIINSGDMTNNPVYSATPENIAEYHKYLSYVRKLSVPIYELPGNHDIGYFDYIGTTYEENYEKLVFNYTTIIGPLNQSFSYQGYRFILINNNPPLSRQPGYISEEIFKWIEKELQHGEKTFVFCHVQILENGTGLPWGSSAERLVSLCNQYNVLAVSYGHQHASHIKTLKNTHYIMCPDLKVKGHQTIYQYKVFENFFELWQYNVISQKSNLMGKFLYETTKTGQVTAVQD